MTTKKLTTIQTVMELLLLSVTYIAIMAGIYKGALGKSDEQMWHCLIILIPMILTYLMRRKVRKYSLFMAGHIALMFVAIIVGHNDLDSTFYFIAVAAVCVHSIRLKMKMVDKSLYMNNPTNIGGGNSEERAEVLSALAATERMSPYYAIVMVGFYIFGGYKNSILLQNIEVTLFVLFIILQVLYNQLQNVNKVFYTNREKSEFPAKQMARINVIIAVLLVVLMIFGMLLFYYGPYGNVFTIAGSILLAVFRLILKIILAVWGLGPESSGDVVEEETTTAEADTGTESPEEYKASPIAEAIAETIGIVLMLVLVGVIIYMIIQYAKKVAASKTEGYDEVEFIKEETKKEHFRDDSLKKMKKNKDTQNIVYRKIYKKRVLQGNHKKKPNETLPPEILTKDTITSQETAAKRITDSYEKARYSKENVSKDEIDFLKKL